MNLKSLEQDKFEPKWWSLLSEEFGQSYMEEIYNKLSKHPKKKDILPIRTEIYKQFRECKYDDVLVCFVTPKPIVTYKQSLLWQYMSTLVELNYYDGFHLNDEENMDYLLPKGIIHIPNVMTDSKDIDHLHLGWQTFTKKAINCLSLSQNKILYLYEDSCLEMLDGVNFNKHECCLLESDCLKKVDEFLLKNYNTTVKW